uniref:Amino acid transporter transmembrane domain-containing protein n=1 Tax=Chromera velia CCMP2878 TaxID=1169474 RepID=A0A0G4HHS9_9ALVE|eukprot:Cvel_1066.t1-p1 / transcript=Cvel_1066.t1 / gene=Cvel_1066 / organism=Chromera_velia_CCMP2878 / gene_product=Vacuolar amino acid transporter 6, putative / transcript_product=Vacuolar amino acid transporter 6, putative / location=Cvel_scaffold34:155861-159451(-) / protein_length=509 / sequence_SO=supercontig / SO=protein_coding / is_pseudo=false
MPKLQPVVVRVPTTPSKRRQVEGTKKTQQHEGASLWVGYVTLLKLTMGAGTLGLPYAFSESGFLVGAVLLVCVTCIALYGGFLLAACSEKVLSDGTPATFGAMTSRASPAFGHVVNTIIMFKCTGTAVSYMIVLGENLAAVAEKTLGVSAESSLATRQFWQFAVFAVFVAPVAFLKDLKALKNAAVLGLIAVLYVLFLAVVYSLLPDSETCAAFESVDACRGKPVAVNPDPVGQLRALPIFFFALTCHQNIPTTFNEMAQPSVGRITKGILLPALTSAAAIFMTIGFAGYLTYGHNVLPDFLLSYPDSDPLVAAGRVALALIATCSCPLQLHPARLSATALARAFLSVVFRNRPERLKAWTTDEGGRSGVLRVILTTFLLSALFATSWVVSSLGLVFDVIGAVGATGLTMYLPGFLFLCLFRKSAVTSEEMDAPTPGTAAAARSGKVAKGDVTRRAERQALKEGGPEKSSLSERAIQWHLRGALFLFLLGFTVMSLTLASLVLTGGGGH